MGNSVTLLSTFIIIYNWCTHRMTNIGYKEKYENRPVSFYYIYDNINTEVSWTYYSRV